MKPLLLVGLVLLGLQGYAQPRIFGALPKSDLSSDAGIGEKDDWLKITSIGISGAGTLLDAATSEIDSGTTSVAGSLGLNFNSKRMECDLYFSYNGRQTVEMSSLENLGNALMNPNVGGYAGTLDATGWLYYELGLTAKVRLADNNWKIDSVTTYKAAPFVFRGGLVLKPFNFRAFKKENEIDFTIELHYTHRSILGNFSQETRMIGGQEIKARGYNGIDCSVNLYLNAVQIFAQFSQNAKGDFSIPGFTGRQVLFGLNISGEMIKLVKE